MEAIIFIKNMLWGPPLIILLLGTGLYFSVKSKFFQFRCGKDFISLFRNNSSAKKGSISPFMALSTALGGTVGVGSIIGVAYSIAIGGEGSIFWMWVSGALGMITKYAEVAIAVKYRKRENGIFYGGAMYALESLGKRKTAVLFAVFGIAASLGAGNLTQTNAISELLGTVGVPTFITAIVVAVLLALIIFKGQKFIASVSSVVVPAISFLYLIIIIAVIVIFIGKLPSAFYKIITEAFGINSVIGGFSGTMISSAFRNGLTKGVFSHEAGMGSSPIAHAASEDAQPHKQGIWGIFEVFFDTFVVSTLTALALILLGTDDIGKLFSILPGKTGAFFIVIAIALFAFAAVLAWCFYAESCIKFLSDSKFLLISYKISFICSAFAGAIISKGIAWELADIFNALMIFPNLALLIITRKEIVAIIRLASFKVGTFEKRKQERKVKV